MGLAIAGCLLQGTRTLLAARTFYRQPIHGTTGCGGVSEWLSAREYLARGVVVHHLVGVPRGTHGFVDAVELARRSTPEKSTAASLALHDVLILDNIEPDAVLASHFDFGSHQSEANLFVQAN